MERYLKISKMGFWHNLLPHCLIAVLMCLLAPFFMGVEGLDASKTALTLECYISLLGIILLTPVFMPEQDKNIRDLVLTKKTSVIKVYCIRLFEAISVLLVLVIIFLIFLKYGECEFPFVKMLFGTVANALFLGGIGILSYSLFDNIAIAYMIPIFYYIINFGGGSKFVGKFYLFSMARVNYMDKWYLFIVGLFLIVAGITWRGIQNKFK